MKNLTFLFAIILILSISACGGTGSEEEVEAVAEKVELKGYEELDLSEWGFSLVVMVPKAEFNGNPEVTLTEGGGLEIIVGTDFGIEIMFGEADFELLKMDLKEDLIFTSEIIKEEENAIIYKQDIPDAGVKTQNHFLYKAVVGVDVYEVRDVAGSEYGSGMIEKMLEASKTIKSVTKVELAA